MTIAEADLDLGYPEIKDSVVPSAVMAGAMQILGPKLAFEMLTTGRRLDAHAALERGFVNRVVGSGEAVEAAIGVASTWAAVEPRALQETKRLFYRMIDMPYA